MLVRRVLWIEGPGYEASSGEAPDPESSPYKTLHGAGGQQRRTRASKGPQLKVKVRTQRKKKEATATTVAKEERSGNGRNKKGGRTQRKIREDKPKQKKVERRAKGGEGDTTRGRTK